jgi:hypothetical protein
VHQTVCVQADAAHDEQPAQALHSGGGELEETVVRGLQPGALPDTSLQPLRTAATVLHAALTASNVGDVPGISQLLATLAGLKRI